jgi:ubiquitin C-terminal hydrolase
MPTLLALPVVMDCRYVTEEDAVGRSDAELAALSLEHYRRRNKSAVADLFVGLLKSTLVCPQCSRCVAT